MDGQGNSNVLLFFPFFFLFVCGNKVDGSRRNSEHFRLFPLSPDTWDTWGLCSACQRSKLSAWLLVEVVFQEVTRATPLLNLQLKLFRPRPPPASGQHHFISQRGKLNKQTHFILLKRKSFECYMRSVGISIVIIINAFGHSAPVRENKRSFFQELLDEAAAASSVWYDCPAVWERGGGKADYNVVLIQTWERAWSSWTQKQEKTKEFSHPCATRREGQIWIKPENIFHSHLPIQAGGVNLHLDATFWIKKTSTEYKVIHGVWVGLGFWRLETKPLSPDIKKGKRITNMEHQYKITSKLDWEKYISFKDIMLILTPKKQKKRKKKILQRKQQTISQKRETKSSKKEKKKIVFPDWSSW